MCLSNAPARFFLLFGLGLTIGTTNAIAQAQSTGAKPVPVQKCLVRLIDEVQLAAGVPGVLEFVTPSEGEEVVAEQVIIGLQADVVKAQKAIAMKEADNDVELQYAEKAAELADAEHRKALEANRYLAGTVAAVEVDRLKLAAQRAHLQIEQAEHTMAINGLKAEEAEANFQVYQIKAPFNGVVTRKYKSRGEAVHQGDPILEIKSTNRVKVEGYISVKDMFRVKKGDPVKVQMDLPNVDLEIEKQEFDGVLKFVDLSVELVSQDVRVWAEVQNPNDILKAGLPAKMTIIPRGGGAVQTTQLTR